jgi:hypothetical protein
VPYCGPQQEKRRRADATADRHREQPARQPSAVGRQEPSGVTDGQQHDAGYGGDHRGRSPMTGHAAHRDAGDYRYASADQSRHRRGEHGRVVGVDRRVGTERHQENGQPDTP